MVHAISALIMSLVFIVHVPGLLFQVDNKDYKVSNDHNAANYEIRQHRRFTRGRRDCNFDEEFRRKEYRRSESLDRKLLMQKSESFEKHRADYRRNTSSSFDSLEVDGAAGVGISIPPPHQQHPPPLRSPKQSTGSTIQHPAASMTTTTTSCMGNTDLTGLVRRVRGMRVSVTPETSV